jgi:hypothetical protein
MTCPECDSTRLFIRLSPDPQRGRCLDCGARLIRVPGGQLIPKSITEAVPVTRAS